MDAQEWKSLPLMMPRAALSMRPEREGNLVFNSGEETEPWYQRMILKKENTETEVAKIVGLPV